ncbi:unnamed protein product [Closterium sp. NIES-54]
MFRCLTTRLAPNPRLPPQLTGRLAHSGLAIRNHLPLAECAHFRQHRTAQALYVAVGARYSSPTSAALGRLLLPYLFPELSAFAIVEDLVSHLRTSDARYRAAAPGEFLDMNHPLMFITLYFKVTRLPHFLRSVRDHFLSLDPTVLTVDQLEQHLLAADTSVVAVGAARGTPRTPFFEGCSPSPLAPSYTSDAAVDVLGAEDVGTASAHGKRHNSKGKGGRGGGGGSGVVVGAAVEVVEALEVVAVVGVVAGVGALVAAVVAAVGMAVLEAVGVVAVGLELLIVEVLAVAKGSSSSVGTRPRCPSSFVSGFLSVGRLVVVVAARMSGSSRSEASGAGAGGAGAGGAVSCRTGARGTMRPRLYFVPLLQQPDSSLPAPSPYTGHTNGFTECRDPTSHPALPVRTGRRVPCPRPPPLPGTHVMALCRLLLHQTLLWHHCLGHPSLPRLRGMHSRLFVSGLPRSLPPLPPSPAPPCLPCVERRQRAAPHSSSFPPATAPLQTLHMDVWGPASIIRLQQRERFGQDLPILRLHSDRGGEFSSDLLRDFCRGEGITQSFTLPDSPQHNGIAEHRIGLVIEVARTSMIHAAAPHFLWPFAVWYAAHQLNLWPRVSLPETSPTLRWTGTVGDALVFRVWGSRAFVRDTSADKLSTHAIPCEAVVSGAAPGTASGGAASGGAEPGGAGSEGAGSGGAESEGAEPGGAELEGAKSGGAEPRGAALSGGLAGASPRVSSQQLREWLVQRTHSRSGATGACEPRDAGAGGAAVTTGARDPTEPGAAGAGGAGAGVAGVGGPRAGGAGAAGAGAVDPGPGGAGGTVRPRPYFVPLLQQVLGVPPSTRLPPPFLCPRPDQSQPPLQPASPLPIPSPYTEQSGGLTERREPASRPVSRVCTARRAPRLRPPPVPGTHTMELRPSSVPLRIPLPAPPESSLPEVSDPASDRARAASSTVARLLAAAVTDPSFESTAASALVAELLDFAAACRLDYASALVAESVPASPPSVGGECALVTDVLEDRQEDFECLAAALSRFASTLLASEGDPDAPDIPTPLSYAEAITGPYSSQWQAAMDVEMASWKSTGTYVDEVPPPGVNIVDGMWIFRVKRPPGSLPAFKARYVARGFSQRQGVDYFQTFSPTPKMTTLRVLLHVAAQRDYELHSLDFSTAFVQGSLHKEIWLRRPPGFTGSFPASTQWSLRRPVYGLRKAPREWHDTLRTTLAALGFAPSTADPSLFLRTDTSLPPFYVLVYVDNLVFATADTEALTLVKSELQKRHTCTDLGELRNYLGVQITPDRARRTITLTQSHMVHQVLQRFGFQYSSPQLTPLSTSHSLSAPPSDESAKPSGPYPELVGCLMYLMTCTRPDLTYPLSLLARYVAPGRHRKVHWDAAKRVLRYLCSTLGMRLVLGGRGPVVLTGHADACWVDDSAT